MIGDEAFWTKVDRSGGRDACWPWQGGVRDNGYGHHYVIGRGQVLAHRYAWEQTIGVIPTGMVIDHLECDDRICCNPGHFQQTSHRHNILRGRGWSARNVAVSACPAGHQYDATNTYLDPRGQRQCRECRKAARRAHHSRDRERLNAKRAERRRRQAVESAA